MSTRCFTGLSENYLQSVFGTSDSLDREFYEKEIWWWNTFRNGDFIGSGNAEDGMSVIELESYGETIFRYEAMARISGFYAHARPWPWVDFDAKFAEVEESGQIEPELFDYREFVENPGNVPVNRQPPKDGWSHHVGFWFRLDAPRKTIIKQLESILDREQQVMGFKPKKPGRKRDKTPWKILELMDETANAKCRSETFDTDRNGRIPALVRWLVGHLPSYPVRF